MEYTARRERVELRMKVELQMMTGMKGRKQMKYRRWWRRQMPKETWGEKTDVLRNGVQGHYSH